MRGYVFCVVAAFALLAVGCDNGKCAGSYSGKWIGTTVPDQIELSSDCAFNYSGVGGCTSAGSYAEPLADKGSVKVTIAASTGGLCLGAGDYSCSYSASTTTLTFNCGAGTFSYSR